jgi:hypothetical protein
MKQLALRDNTPPRAAFRSSAVVGCIRPQRVSARDVSTYWSLPRIYLSVCLSVCDDPIRLRRIPAQSSVPCYSVKRLSECLW